MRIGSLCSGYGGLDMAAEALTGGRTVWVSDVDKGANKILAHRYPDVPNLGDFTVMDWSTVEPIDVLTAGYPCQPFSHAGKRAGTNDARHLWPEVLRCLTTLRPPFALFENVRGHLSLGFDQVLADLATDDYDARWIVLRAADIGAPHGRARLFILASDARRGGDRWDLVGAGRGSVRVGGVRGEDPDGGADAGRADLRLLSTPQSRDHKGVPSDGFNQANLCRDVSLLPTPVASEGTKPSNTMGVERRKATGEVFLTNVIVSMCGLDPTEAQRLLPTPTSADSKASGGSTPSDVTLTDAVVRTNLGEQENPRHAHTTEARPGEVLRDVRGADVPQAIRSETRGPDALPVEEELLAGVRQHEGRGHEGRISLAGAEAQGAGLSGLRDDEAPACSSRRPESGEQRSGEPDDAMRDLPPETALAGGSGEAARVEPVVAWGPYEPAIRRWELILGRPAPMPTQLSAKGNPQLSPRFVEFLMGLPEGWVDDVPNLTRNEKLKALGNGVVSQQAVEAVLRLLALGEVAA